jgi:uncharacterized membrane protein YhaH (DUF805 family)
MRWYLHVIKNYGEFNGRAGRKEYWMFMLCHVIFSIVALVLDSEFESPGVAYFVYNVFLFVPGLAVTIRRLHDIGKSGWFILIGLVPVIGPIGLLALTLKRGEDGPNAYGVEVLSPA